MAFVPKQFIVLISIRNSTNVLLWDCRQIRLSLQNFLFLISKIGILMDYLIGLWGFINSFSNPQIYFELHASHHFRHSPGCRREINKLLLLWSLRSSGGKTKQIYMKLWSSDRALMELAQGDIIESIWGWVCQLHRVIREDFLKEVTFKPHTY